MSRNRPLARRDPRATALVSLRARELTRLQHVLERLHSPRLQMSVIVASFVYNAAMRDQMLPRKPIEKPLPMQAEKKD